MEFILENILLSGVLGYLILVNSIAFTMYGIDKSAAASRKRRTPEKHLWLVALIGGSVGSLLGMHFFRHKTRKVSFQFTLALIVLIQCVLLYLFSFYSGFDINQIFI
jgi:uncharacterized membrane protein YsdA (DUF1294 family)